MNTEINRTLIIDDDEDYRNLIIRKLKRSFPDIEALEIDPLKDTMPDESYEWQNIDFIILDYNLGLDFTGLDWFKRFEPDILPATLLLTAQGSEELAVKAIKLGLDDYVVKEKFDIEKLAQSIEDSVRARKHTRNKREKLSRKRIVFNKYNFIERLKLITKLKDTKNHLLLINPVSYQEIGQQQGINHQDRYINFIAESIFTYLDSKDISHNIFIYREEYIAVIFEAKSYKRHLNFICKLCQNLEYEIGQIGYSCDVKVGIISPKSLEVQELEKSDFELMSIAMVLCNSVESGEESQVCSYGDIKIEQQASVNEDQSYSSSLHLFNIENAIEEGRVSANYQPWVYIHSEEHEDVKEIYDVRIELIDTRGNTVSQNLLLKLLDDAYAKRIVDKWVLRNVGNTIKELYSKNRDNTIKLAAKITLSSINDQAFIPWLRELLTEIDLPNDYLLLEIDATQLIRNPDAYQLLFNTVAVEFNIKFILSGIHNIGAYYDARIIHSFDYVKLNINQVLETDSRSSLQQLINEIKRDNVNVVAVNVSDAEMLALATEFDVDYMHGYLIGKPILDVLSDTHGDLYCVI